MRYGSLPVLVTIMQRVTDATNVRGSFVSLGVFMASIRQTTGRQQVEAGLPEDMIDLVVRFAHTAVSAAITIEDRLIVALAGVSTAYAIKSVGLPERRGGFVEVTCIRSIGN